MTTATTPSQQVQEEVRRLFGSAEDMPKVVGPTDDYTAGLDDQQDGWASAAIADGLVVLVAATDSGYYGWGIAEERLGELADALSQVATDWSEGDALAVGPLPWDALDDVAERVSPT